MAHGHFHWNELMTRDAEGAKKFYADVIGWTFDAMDMGEGGTYYIARDGETMLGGMFDMTAAISMACRCNGLPISRLTISICGLRKRLPPAPRSCGRHSMCRASAALPC